MLIPLILSATGCASWLGAGASGACPIRPVYSEADVDAISDQLAEWILSVELQGAAMGCWELDE